MAKYKGIPITAAKLIADKYDKDQVIIVTFDKTHGRTHVTTYGKTKQECKEAALGGNLVKKALGWPENEIKPIQTKKPNALIEKLEIDKENAIIIPLNIDLNVLRKQIKYDTRLVCVDASGLNNDIGDYLSSIDELLYHSDVYCTIAVFVDNKELKAEIYSWDWDHWNSIEIFVLNKKSNLNKIKEELSKITNPFHGLDSKPDPTAQELPEKIQKEIYDRLIGTDYDPTNPETWYENPLNKYHPNKI